MSTIPLFLIEDEPFKAKRLREMVSTNLKKGKHKTYHYSWKYYSSLDKWTSEWPIIPFGIYLVDINLGKGGRNEGLRVIEKVKEHAPGSKVIAVTAYSDVEELVLELGASYYQREGTAEKLEVSIQNISNEILEASPKLSKILEKNPNTGIGKYFAHFVNESQSIPPTLLPVKDIFHLTWLDIDVHATEERLMTEYESLIHYSLQFDKLEEEPDWGDRICSYGLAEDSTFSENSPDFPRYFALNKDSEGYINDLYIDGVAFSFSWTDKWKVFRNLKRDKPLYYQIFFEQIYAFNLFRAYQNSELSTEEICEVGFKLPLAIKVTFMQRIFKDAVKNVILNNPHAEISKIEKAVREKSHFLCEDGTFPFIFDMELGEVLEVDEEENIALVRLRSFLNKIAEPRQANFLLKKLKSQEMDSVGAEFLFTTFQSEKKYYSAKIELKPLA